MGRPAFLRHIETDSGTLSGGSWEASLPLANIREQDLMQVARSTDDATASTQLRIDFGTSITRWLSMVVVLGHNISAAGTWKLTLSANSDGSSPSYDTGWLDAWRAVEVFGANPWGGFGWDGTSYPEGFVSPPTLRHVLPAVQQLGNGGARYLHLFIDDTTNAAGYVQIGRLLGGPVWQPEVGPDLGATVHPVDPSEVRRTRGGLRVAGNDARYRLAKLRLGFLTESEAIGFVHEWARLGKGRELWFEEDLDRSDEAGDRRAMYCALAETPALPRVLRQRFAAELLLEELT